jgi:hypothetical protein
MATAIWKDGAAIAPCPGCNGAVSRFLPSTGPNKAAAYVEVGLTSYRTRYWLLECAGCGRGALAEVSVNPNPGYGDTLQDFYPFSPEFANVPSAVPPDLRNELQEAEVAASVRAYRAATALLRSTLEKTLKANGYSKGTLEAKIDAAEQDHVITAARKRQVHEDVRRLGNDVVHDDWRLVTVLEYEQAHQYVEWLLEDFYADRPTVQAELVAANRLDASGNPIT